MSAKSTGRQNMTILVVLRAIDVVSLVVIVFVIVSAVVIEAAVTLRR